MAHAPAVLHLNLVAAREQRDLAIPAYAVRRRLLRHQLTVHEQRYSTAAVSRNSELARLELVHRYAALEYRGVRLRDDGVVMEQVQRRNDDHSVRRPVFPPARVVAPRQAQRSDIGVIQIAERHRRRRAARNRPRNRPKNANRVADIPNFAAYLQAVQPRSENDPRRSLIRVGV